jgi:hypothetical protein
VARIDAPQLDNLEIFFFNQNIFDVPQIPQFTQFISRTPMFKLEALEKAYVAFQLEGAGIKLLSQTSGYGQLKVKIPCRGLNQQVSSLKRFCTSYLPLSASEDLYIYGNIDPQPNWEDDVENILWLELLHLFTGVKNLHLSEHIAPHFGSALQGLVGGSTTEVLPIVQMISFEGIQPWGAVPVCIEKFIAARQLSGRPITVSTTPLWERDFMRWAEELNNR